MMRSSAAGRAYTIAVEMKTNCPVLPANARISFSACSRWYDRNWQTTSHFCLPISFSLLDAFTNGVAHRPEVQQAIVSIDNTSIRQEVADNGRLPQLDLRLQTKLQNLGESPGSALGNTFNLDPSESWLAFIASFASVVLTFLAGAEVDPDDFRERFGTSLAIGVASFLFRARVRSRFPRR